MFQKPIHKVKFYPSADGFTQVLLVMLVTNIMSGEGGTKNARVISDENQINILYL